MYINLTIDRFEEDKAVLKTENNETIIWPKDKLPAEAREGSVLQFEIKADKAAAADKKQLAKDILNEILNPDDAQ